MKNRIILALDCRTLKEVDAILEEIKSFVGLVKIGSELFTSLGPEGVKAIYNRYSLPVFLDLKFHDIPRTVSASIKATANIPCIFMTTIHACGGKDMMIAAKKAAPPYLKIIAVTELTNTECSVDKVLRKVEMAHESKLDGIVCSALEVAAVKKYFPDLISICPGIRIEGIKSPNDDQARVSSPAFAIKNGADFIVVGRTITSAKNRAEKMEMLVKSINNIAI